MSIETVDIVTNSVQNAANKLVYKSCSELETFLKTFANRVHENHVILLYTKTVLIGMYDNKLGLLSNDQCKRKRKLCEEVIKA
jgi:hypothetical protein